MNVILATNNKQEQFKHSQICWVLPVKAEILIIISISAAL